MQLKTKSKFNPPGVATGIFASTRTAPDRPIFGLYRRSWSIARGKPADFRFLRRNIKKWTGQIVLDLLRAATSLNKCGVHTSIHERGMVKQFQVQWNGGGDALDDKFAQ
jgi:hypothetical protein